MEVKTLLRIIKDDVAHLESITGEFNQYSLPSPDEIDVALVRANALLKELELLHKLALQHEGSYKAVQPAEEARAEASDDHHSEQEPFELFVRDSADDEKVSHPDIEQPDIVPAVEVRENVIVPGNEQHIAKFPGVTVDNFRNDLKKAAETQVPSGAGDMKSIASNEEVIVEPGVPVNDDTVVVEVEIVPIITDQLEDVIAEEFKEEKKTLNETLGEPHKMVNDFLTPDKGEVTYHNIPINSIWDGIGINDRFLFIRELFANNSTKFESTVEAIDQLGSIHEAVNYLKMNFKWNKTEASQKFLVLVKRRFTK